MTMRELLGMKELTGEVRMVTGESGLTNRIRWVYFADCALDVEESREVKEFIHGGELVIFTNRNLLDFGPRVLGMIESMAATGIAGLLITEGQISPEIEAFCAARGLPLGAISPALHMIDFSQIVCRALIEEAQEIHSTESLLSAILFSAEPDKSEILRQARTLHVQLTGPMKVICIENADPGDGGDPEEMQRKMRHRIKMAFTAANLPLPLMTNQLSATFLLVPENTSAGIKKTGLLESLMEDLTRSTGKDAIAGVGGAYEYVEGFRESLSEARRAIRIGKTLGGDPHVFRYEDLGVYAMIAQIPDKKFLDTYVERTIGPLLAADRLNTGNMAKTLEAFIAHSGSISETADALYIHRNTLRYRLDKIREMTGCDLGDYSQLFTYQLAFAIRRFRAGET